MNSMKTTRIQESGYTLKIKRKEGNQVMVPHETYKAEASFERQTIKKHTGKLDVYTFKSIIHEQSFSRS